ncbi:hypothetical protein ATANTOWER_031930 [Ataeniobius toweri]|uniref:Phosphatidylinositol-specific phospholipase C X domain-containing protein n=2 Tax=Goodeidae TaxID=28758 RepID=A0ABU7AC37_9TELE|nr:hypothetical protein [Ataeniobius toweri]
MTPAKTPTSLPDPGPQRPLSPSREGATTPQETKKVRTPPHPHYNPTQVLHPLHVTSQHATPTSSSLGHDGEQQTAKPRQRQQLQPKEKKKSYPLILSIENHCSVPQQKKMAQYLIEILGDKLDVSSVKADESGRLPSPESLRGKILVKGKKLPPNIDENAEEGDVSDEDSADEMEDDCKLMNGDWKVLYQRLHILSSQSCPIVSHPAC